MKKWLLLLVLQLTLLGAARADVLVLVHGYLGTAQSWAEAGALARLHQRGYRLAGIYGYSSKGVLYQAVTPGRPAKPVYSVNLPSQAPVVIQADPAAHTRLVVAAVDQARQAGAAQVSLAAAAGR